MTSNLRQTQKLAKKLARKSRTDMQAMVKTQTSQQKPHGLEIYGDNTTYPEKATLTCNQG